MSGYVSSGGVISSRVFTVRMLRNALRVLPETQTREVRRLAQALDKRTGIGYYASLELIANIGVHLLKVPSSWVSSQLSSKTSP